MQLSYKNSCKVYLLDEASSLKGELQRTKCPTSSLSQSQGLPVNANANKYTKIELNAAMDHFHLAIAGKCTLSLPKVNRE